MTSRRRFLHLAAATAALLPCRAWRARRPIRRGRCASWSPPPAGGTTDIVARLLAQRLSDKLGQPFVVENRPGGGTNIGTEMAVRAPPDGYTLLMANSSAVTPALHKTLPFTFLDRPWVPVGSSCARRYLMLVNPSMPAKTGARVHRLRQGQSRQGQHGLGRRRLDRPHVRRAVQMDGGHQAAARALPRRGDGPARPDCRPGPGHVLDHRLVAAIREGRQASGARHHHRDAVGAGAGGAAGRGFRPG